MKKTIYLTLIILFIFGLSGCKIKSTDLPITGKKPDKSYYSRLLANALSSDKKATGTILETNLHKEKQLTDEGTGIVLNFFKSLHNENFIEKPADLPEKPLFRIYINPKGERYVINIYNEKYISIQPWDGVYPMDYIKMDNVAALYNLHGFCNYFFK